MLTEERLQAIEQLIKEKGSVSNIELMDELNISESTVRRDLTILDDQGRINKVRGGAMIRSDCYNSQEATMTQKKDLNIQEKTVIAKYASSLIEPGDFVFLDAGSTTELMIDHLNEKNVTFVTNAVSHAKKLSEAGYTTYILGGEFKATTEAIVGDETIDSLQKYNFTKGFFGANGIHERVGITTPDVKEAAVKKEALKHCMKKFVLCDPSKFSQISSVKFAQMEQVKILTTMFADDKYDLYDNIIKLKI